MIEIYSVQPAVLARMKPGPVGSYLGSFGVWLEQCGYSKNSILDKLHAADEFGWWLHKKGLSLCDVGEDTVARYVAGFPRIPCAGKPLCAYDPGTLHLIAITVEGEEVKERWDGTRSKGRRRC